MKTNNQVKGSGTLSEINVTPLVDVMLVLLIIFMVTSPMLHQGIDVQLPKASKRVFNEQEQTRYIITITKDLKVFLNQSQIPIEQLNFKLRQLKNTQNVNSIFLKADERVQYGDVIKIIDEIKKAGIDTIGMVTEEESEK